MPSTVVLLSIPGLRAEDLGSMPALSQLAAGGQATLAPSFPALTCPVQANLTTGALPAEHGVIANGFFWRDKQEVEMWTAWNDCIERPQIWDRLHEKDPALTSAVWFPLHIKGCGADYICTFAPIHNPDGSESLWCYTRPTELYGELRDALDHFPLKHFWGPLAGIPATDWIVDSATLAAERWRPNFWTIYLPHLDYAAQKFGPDSPQALAALAELDGAVARLVERFHAAYDAPPLWLAASEYTIVPVDHVLYPNRLLREAGLLHVREENGLEYLDLASPAWALCDHQLAHVFVRERDTATIERAADLFRGAAGVAEVLVGEERAKYGLAHQRSGEIVLVSTANSWQAYYWWFDDSRAPDFARTVDIHRKPGYDPCEMIFDPATKGISLDATLIRGSHGAPAASASQCGVLLSSEPNVLPGDQLRDIDVARLVLKQFGV
ncbi:MAG: alkaline phosphatase family protein [Planctomycetales bacterium]|nr:alkaline phosphatase family protein [Planctomycetales bacterium]